MDDAYLGRIKPRFLYESIDVVRDTARTTKLGPSTIS